MANWKSVEDSVGPSGGPPETWTTRERGGGVDGSTERGRFLSSETSLQWRVTVEGTRRANFRFGVNHGRRPKGRK